MHLESRWSEAICKPLLLAVLSCVKDLLRLTALALAILRLATVKVASPG